MKGLTRYLLELWPVIGLSLLVLLLAFLNHHPGTWLSGWDNLHPELGINSDIQRSLTAAWQEYRGLGLLGGMAHAADLPRQLLVMSALNLGFPAQLVRYTWTFLMLGLGSLGVYWLSASTILRKFDKNTRRLAAFFAGLFYLLNLGTVQNFYAPFETFTSFFGFLPWLLLTHLNYLKKPTRRNALWLVVGQLLAAPAFYVHTLFLVYLVTLLPFYLQFLFEKHPPHHKLVQIIISGLLVLFSSAYWLFPAGYYALTNSQTTLNAAQNQVATREVIARNRELGTLSDVSTLKGFWFDYVDLGDNDQFDLMMRPWIRHLDQDVVQILGYFFFALILVAVFFAFRRKLSYRWPLTTLLILCIFFLLNLNPPTGEVFRFLQNIPLVKEVFRSVFTKWVAPSSLVYSLFFGLGMVFLLDLFSGLSYRLTVVVTSFSLGLALLLYSAPAFMGHLIYSKMQVKIPSDYFQLFDYLKNQDPSLRIANFPQQTFWGWQFYDWGYRGSGFLWYGIRQPILDRAFDVWSGYSEEYYQEIRQAVYSQNSTLLQALLDKYAVGFILLDRHITVPGTDDDTTLYNSQLESMLERLPQAEKAGDFGSISLYRYQPAGLPKAFVNTRGFPSQAKAVVSQSFGPVYVDTPQENHSQLTEKTNCDNFNSTFFDRILDLEKAQYQAINANSCDHFVYPDLQHNIAYRLNITHRNLKGEPLLVCLEDHVSKQCQVFEYLPASPDWTTTAFDIPPLKPEEKGYTLHLYNYSIGQVETVNEWSQISFSPAATTLESYATLSGPYLSVRDAQRLSSALYTVRVDAPEGGYVVLNQSFDQGWRAIALERDSKPTSALLPLLNRAPLPSSSHIKFYGWANSWVVPENTGELIIFFTPQVWQWIGFCLLLLLPILVLAHRTKKAPEEGR